MKNVERFKKVYSCCLLGLLSLTVLGVLLSPSSHKKNNVTPTLQMSPNLSSPIPTSKEKTLLILAVGNFLPKLRRILGIFVILKITSLGILVPFFILNNNNNVPKGGNNGDGGDLRMGSSPARSNPMGTLGLAFTSCGTAFTLVYVLVLALFVLEGSKGAEKEGSSNLVVVGQGGNIASKGKMSSENAKKW
ncbi:hypothetical protein Fcan01_18349 [Folsomia candida]|uniref:Uncharacterized protein n=1 Tax=Folsomia candida TaxID=158441 RepID=A0A226DSA2_FOLCA|nr:hypothetical protein Fcan01_18349 [Folsomia candida]